MREIKFRGWDKNRKLMVSVATIAFWKGKAFLDSPCQDWYDFSNIELMQFTGLKDKNGKEIYEFDLVKIEKYGKIISDYIWIVKFDQFEWCFERDEGTEFYDRYSFPELNKFEKDCEVIGNIYEEER